MHLAIFQQRWLFAKFIRGFSRNTAHGRTLQLIPELEIDDASLNRIVVSIRRPADSLESAHRSISTESHLFPNTSRAISREWRIRAEAPRDPEVKLIEGAPLWNNVSTIARAIAR